MNHQRPNPDLLLARVQAEEQRAKRGHLKVFFGMAPGVGKTYKMLEAAQAKRAEGVDVLVGVVETHRRAETAALVEGLEMLSLQERLYQGRKLAEFDLDAALKRKPGLLLVDELAHSNIEGSRHAKRWQDVDELLSAGIDVYTTVNVQHLESVNDIVGQITGIRVQETIPDLVFEQADDVELIDLPADELLQRLSEGKVYLPEQAERAAQHFFRKGNLIALRELALRRTAERVDAQMRDYRNRHDIQQVWAASERLLVAIGPTPDAEHLIRAGKRMATALNASWIVTYVETPALQKADKNIRERLLRALELAESLGAETVTLAGPLISAEILGCAQARNITKLLVGKPTTPTWKRWFNGSAIDTIIKEARHIDVFVIGTEPDASTPLRASKRFLARSQTYEGIAGIDVRLFHRRRRILASVMIMTLCTLIAWPLHEHLDNTVLIMVYLLGVVFTSARYGQIPAVVAAFLSVASFDFFYVPPYMTFAVEDSQYLLTFAVMLIVALVISRLASGLRMQAQVAGYRERRIAELYAMSREFSGMRNVNEICDCAIRHVNTVFSAHTLVLLPDRENRIAYPDGLAATQRFIPEQDLATAQWVFDRNHTAGHGTDTLPSAEALFLPIVSSQAVIGVLAVHLQHWERLREPEQRQQLDMFVGQIALALERVSLASQAESSRMASETERLRNSLLAAISHDLRTPLSTLIGAAAVLAKPEALDDATRCELATNIHEEAERMGELITKVLDMARLESGTLEPKQEWTTLEEILGAALATLRPRLQQHHLKIDVPSSLGLIKVDPVLFERVLANLLENAAKYTPANSTISVEAMRENSDLLVIISDDGPGLEPGSEERIFDKFFRQQPESHSPGVGLGLTICRAIVDAHQGNIVAGNLPNAGAFFKIRIPQHETAPAISDKED